MALPNVGWTKFFSAQKGYGFLTDLDTGREVFVHYTALQRRDRGWRGLYRGEYVAYRPFVDENGHVSAVEVTGVGGGPLMCEANAVTEPEFA